MRVERVAAAALEVDEITCGGVLVLVRHEACDPVLVSHDLTVRHQVFAAREAFGVATVEPGRMRQPEERAHPATPHGRSTHEVKNRQHTGVRCRRCGCRGTSSFVFLASRVCVRIVADRNIETPIEFVAKRAENGSRVALYSVVLISSQHSKPSCSLPSPWFSDVGLRADRRLSRLSSRDYIPIEPQQAPRRASITGTTSAASRTWRLFFSAHPWRRRTCPPGTPR